MPSIDEQLRRWRSAGLIDEPTANRIAEFERSSTPEPSASRPGILEAFLYLGVAIAGVGTFVLLGDNWEQLRPWARILALAAPLALTLLAGLVMRASSEPGVVRAGHVAWMLSVALLAGTVAVAGNELDIDDRDWLVYAGLAATALALVLWVVAPSHPQILGVAAALVLLASGIGAFPDDHNVLFGGVMVTLFGAVALVFVEMGLLSPAALGRAVFGLMAAAGIYAAGLDDDYILVELLAFAAGGALIALSIWRGLFVYMILGVAVIFVALVTFIFEHFADTIGAPLALIISGATLVAGALIVARFRHQRLA